MGMMLAAVSIAPNAFAFSTVQPMAQNSDGSPKFADPDEQMPGFMVAPDDSEASNRALSFGNATPVTPPTPKDYDSGARAFDQAFAHQQDKE